MLFEPPLDHARLIEIIRDTYGLEVRDLRFLPIGFAACYEVLSADATRYFLKAWPQLRLGEPAAEEQCVSLEVSRALHEGDFGLLVAHPLLTRDGAVWAHLDGTPLALFPHLEGHVGGPWTKADYEAIGRAIAALHRATPAIEHLLTRHESFEVAYEPELRHHIEEASALPSSAPAHALAARDWVLANRADLDAQLARLHQLQPRVRALDCVQVVCHMDLHGNNVLLDAEGLLHIIDWDDVRLAPPEHDLWFGLNAGIDPADFRTFIEAYRRTDTARPLHLDHFAFYLLRRDLEDTAIALARLLDPTSNRRDDDRWLRGLHDWGTARWHRLDDTLAMVAAALR